MGVLSRPGLQTFSETANVCLHNALMCSLLLTLLSKVINKVLNGGSLFLKVYGLDRQ